MRAELIRWLAPPAALVAGILPVVNDWVVFPSLSPVAQQDRSLIPWFEALDSFIIAVFSFALALVAFELYRQSIPSGIARATRTIGVVSGGIRGVMFLLLATTLRSLPDDLNLVDLLLTVGMGLWILLTAATWRRGRDMPSTLFTGLGILVGALLVMYAMFGTNLSPLIRNLGYPVWFVWLGIRMWRDTEVATPAPARVAGTH